MERNIELFPNDELGDRLWQLQIAGVDLTAAKEVEFSTIFATRELALKFGQVLLENSQKLSFCPYDGDDEFPWEITAYPYMELSYENIIAYQSLLISTAEPLQGKYDGWFCVSAEQPE